MVKGIKYPDFKKDIRPVASICVLQTNHIGDLLITTPLLEALRRGFPGARITAAVGSWNSETLKNNPNVDNIFIMDPPWNNAFARFRGLLHLIGYILFSKASRQLSDAKYDIGVDVVGTRPNRLMLARICVKKIVGGVFGEGGCSGLTEHKISIQLRLAEELGIDHKPDLRPQIHLDASERLRGLVELWGDCHPTHGRRHRVIIAPAGSNRSKCWPKEYYLDLAKKLAGRRDISIVMVGGQDTVEVGKYIEKADSDIRNYIGKISIRETFALTAISDLVICNSNMVWHVSGAFRIPAVVLLSETLGSAEKHAISWGYPSSRVFGISDQHQSIYTPEEVMATIQEILPMRSNIQNQRSMDNDI